MINKINEMYESVTSDKYFKALWVLGLVFSLFGPGQLW